MLSCGLLFFFFCLFNLFILFIFFICFLSRRDKSGGSSIHPVVFELQ